MDMRARGWVVAPVDTALQCMRPAPDLWSDDIWLGVHSLADVRNALQVCDSSPLYSCVRTFCATVPCTLGIAAFSFTVFWVVSIGAALHCLDMLRTFHAYWYTTGLPLVIWGILYGAWYSDGRT